MENKTETWQQQCLAALENNLASHWDIPADAFYSRSVQRMAGKHQQAIWSPFGGIIRTDDEVSARILQAIISSHYLKKDTGAISDDFPLFQHLGSIGITTFDILHYLHTPREISHTDEIIVELADDDPFRASLPPAVEHIFAVRNAAEIITYAYSLPQISCGSSTIYAVGAMTHAAYRRRGLGKGVVAALVKQLSAEKNLALWNCDARNEASLRLARATGFIRHIWHLAWRTI